MEYSLEQEQLSAGMKKCPYCGRDLEKTERPEDREPAG